LSFEVKAENRFAKNCMKRFRDQYLMLLKVREELEGNLQSSDEDLESLENNSCLDGDSRKDNGKISNKKRGRKRLPKYECDICLQIFDNST
jgi:hypothetical protein